MTENDDDDKLVLRRGMAEHVWHEPSDYVPPVPKDSFDWRAVLPKSDAPPATPEERANRWAYRVRMGIAVLIAASLAVLALNSSFKGFRAEGVSMEPTLHDGDHIVVNKLAYAQVDFGLLDWAPLIDPSSRWSEPARGDVIVFSSPLDGRELVKRVIALPGETVTIDPGGQIFVNEVLLADPWAKSPTVCTTVCAWTVPTGNYFVLGDNRQDSRDSREGWTVPLENIDGEKLLTY
jgi:signal peptidase I